MQDNRKLCVCCNRIYTNYRISGQAICLLCRGTINPIIITQK